MTIFDSKIKPILLKILTILGIKREKPQTKIGRIGRRCEHAVSVLVFLYIGIAFFPQPLFSHQLEHEGITLYSTKSISSEKGKVLLSEVRSKIKLSDLYNEQQEFQVFLCNSKSLYTLFSPFSRESFGQANLFSNIIIANANLDANIVTAFRDKHNERSFTSVITHEIGHEMIKDEFGLVSAYRAPKWLNEGYCEYISDESSFPESQGIEMITQGKTEDSNSFKYFEYRKMVEFYLDEKGKTIKELFSSSPLESNMRDQTRQWLRRIYTDRALLNP